MGKDGSFTDRRLYLSLIDVGLPDDAYPDGIKLMPDGDLYIGLYSARRLLMIDPATKKLVKTIDVPSAAVPIRRLLLVERRYM